MYRFTVINSGGRRLAGPVSCWLTTDGVAVDEDVVVRLYDWVDEYSKTNQERWFKIALKF